MKLEFLRSGSADSPLIRLYDFDATQAHQLQQIILRLAQNQNEIVALHAEPDVQPMAGCELTLRQGEKDLGVTELGELKFEWIFTNGGWLDVAALIQPLRRDPAAGHQWLSRSGRIRVLLSRDGQW